METSPFALKINSETGDRIVELLAGGISTSWTDLIAAQPAFAEPANATHAAQVINHLSQGRAFSVILDPDGFKSEFITAYEAEDPDAPLVAGQPMLQDFGMPDFAKLALPAVTDGTLVFCTWDKFTRIPYRVTASLDTGAAEYEPFDMT